MFKKTARLTKKEFDLFYKKGTRKQFTHCTIVSHPHPSLHVAVVVGKKVAKSAVRRNVLRRRVYNWIKSPLTKKGYAGVLIILLRPNFNHLDRKTAQEHICTAVEHVITH